jgi:hypothetical protein
MTSVPSPAIGTDRAAESSGGYLVWGIFALGFLIRVALIAAYPALYGGDTVLRLVNHHRILMSHQMLLLQMLIYAGYVVKDDPYTSRLLVSLIGAGAGVGFYLMSSRLLTRRAALIAALFFLTNPFLLEISIVPYQEILMLGALCFAAYFYLQGQIAWCSVFLALACFARYEAWLACPLFAADYATARPRRLKEIATACLLFGWAPLVWLAMHFGLSSPGSFVIEAPHSPLRLMRWIYIAWITVKDTPVPVLLCAVVFLAFVVRARLCREKFVRYLAAFAVLFCIAILLSAHGETRNGGTDAERFVTSREATFPVAAVILLAAAGLQALYTTHRGRLAAGILAASGILLGCYQSARFIHQQAGQPDVQLAYRLARWIDSKLSSGENISIVTKPISPQEIQLFLEKAKQAGGEAGFEKAQANLRELNLPPLDCGRTIVQTRLGRAHIFCGDRARNQANWLAVWNDAPFNPQLEADLRTFQLISKLQEGSREVTIYRRL